MCFSFFVLLFLVTPCLAVAVQHCMEWIPIQKMCFLRVSCREKGSQYTKSWARTLRKELKPSIPHFVFNEVSSISKKPYEGRVIPVLGYLRYCNNLDKLPPSVLIFIDLPILIFSTFIAFIDYSIIGSINYFGQVALEILENNLLKSYFGNRNRDFVTISGNFLKEKINLAKLCFFKKTLK